MTNHKTALRSGAIAAAMKVDGWLSPDEAGALYDAAYDAIGPIVEIGSWQGRSTVALGLGSQHGSKQPVYAIDNYQGVPPGDRESAHGLKPGWDSSTPEIVRANLDRCGVNGLVTIIAKPSQDAVGDIPPIGALFVDGGHDYEAVRRDFDLYLPKVMLGGRLMVHDCTQHDPDVVRAFDESVMSDKMNWRVLGRVDSAMLAERCEAISRTVCLGLPGRSWGFETMLGIFKASLGAHEVQLANNSNGFDDFNAIWARALNDFEAGRITHFAMLHSDISPAAGWLDVLLGEMEARGADMVSVPVPLKDTRGLTSSGIGDLSHPWAPYKRFTIRELMEMPETFGIEDTGHPDKVLLHNSGCFVLDLRNELFRKTLDDGQLFCTFDFPTSVVRSREGVWMNLRESEDWYFSRQMHLLGLKTFITRKVRLSHIGDAMYPNHRAWGSYRNGDEDTAQTWRETAIKTEQFAAVESA